METYEKWDIQELPLSSPFFRKKVESFLEANGLRMEALDSYFTLQGEDGRILAGAGLQKDILKCVAVGSDMRSEGLMVLLVSHVLSIAAFRGLHNLKVFTKPEYETVFESLGFHLLAAAPKAILMENGRGLEDYCSYLAGFRKAGSSGVVVMNANPFTIGHEYLLQQAAGQVDNLFVIPVKEDLSRFPYAERRDMIRAGAPEDAIVLEGSDYQISAATFPTYFLKDLSDASETQMLLDIDLFCRHIAPAIGAGVRFAGSEPSDPLTARYNSLMREMLPQYGLEFRELERLCDAAGPVSATRVRTALDRGSYHDAAAITPVACHKYLLAELADRALTMELNAPLKPGLVGPDSRGAHSDMDVPLMLGGISAIRPFWPGMAVAQDSASLQKCGQEAEKAMMAATGGVNTHRGAIFCLGLAVNAAGTASDRDMEATDSEALMQNRVRQVAQSVFDNRKNDSELHITHGRDAVARYNVRGAMEMALDGYKELVECWLQYYRSVKDERLGLQKTLLMIMSQLDDTCVIHRVGYERALEVKREAAAMLNDGCRHLEEMCSRYAAEGISPGGAADMLAMTVFIESILN